MSFPDLSSFILSIELLTNMYQHTRNRFRPNSRSSRHRGNPFRAKPNQRTFNPSLLIKNVQAAPVSSETVTTGTGTFNSFQIAPELKRNVLNKGYRQTTPIQDQAIPYVLDGRDVIGIANTGTGKTAAFLVPLINKVLKNRNEKILILTPTRELAVQIRDEFLAFAQGLWMYSVLCIGGSDISRQKDHLRQGFNFVIATPGRLKDLVKSHSINLGLFNSVVLDEADLMVDIGFLHEIKEIISLLPERRQSLFFSATVDGKVREVLTSFVTNPVTVSVKTGETAQNVKQEIIQVVDRSKKVDLLHDLLIQKDYEKVLIFGRTKWGVQKLSDELIKRGFKADAIHGNKRQSQRQRILEKFKRNEIQILLATDVASRGLDIPNVSHVINYDLPESQEAYVHRIGRTGRLDKKGIALTFVG